MLRQILLYVSLLLIGTVHAASTHDIHLDHVEVDLTDKASLQKGAKTFVNYCMGCHSAELHRYQHIVNHLDIPQELFEENLLFSDEKIGSLMKIAMKKEHAEEWFGVIPPDLSLMSRLKGPGQRGPDYLYTFLRSFYMDESRQWGVNNKVFPNTAMPHVLLEMQGEQKITCKNVSQKAENGGVLRDPLTGEDITKEECGFLELVPETGTMTPDEYDETIKDLVNFLTYLGDPNRVDRHRIGTYVLLFLALLFVFAYLLKREYWKDVH